MLSMKMNDRKRSEIGQKPVSSPDECFVHEIRNALNHLYDPEFLRDCALADLLGIAHRFDSPSVLQDILTRAIESLKPDAKAPNKSHAQGIYDLLLFRYLQQFQQSEIANQLGISIRHLRRKQTLAIYELANKLWVQYHLEKTSNLPMPVDDSPSIQTGPAGAELSLSKELDWLKNSTDQMPTDLFSALSEVQDLIQPLAKQKNIRVNFPQKIDGMVLAHPVAFQQIMLNIITVVIHHITGHEATLNVFSTPEHKTIEVYGKSSLQNLTQEEEDGLYVIHQLAEMCQCKFDVVLACNQFKARVTFEIVKQLVVMVVDDNAELITMMSRFASQTRYRIIGESDPHSAVSQAIQVRPDLVVLDIMMPQVDGLQLLSHFKHHPELGKIPVVVCSVLPQKLLATSLGASGFLQKPIQRESFLETLNQTSREIEPVMEPGT